MKARAHLLTALAVVCLATIPASAQQAAGQELNAEAKSKESAETRAKRNAQWFQNSASILTFLDRYGQRTGELGERKIYDGAIQSPDGKLVAAIWADPENETWDLWVLTVATGAAKKLTTSARTEWVSSPVWSPDSTRIAYVTIRKGQEGAYVRAANGEGDEELLYQNPGAYMNLSDWSSDGRSLVFTLSDLKGGTLYLLPLEKGRQSKAVEVFHTESRLWGARFSPDGRFISYVARDKANRMELFVRPADPQATDGPWQISDCSSQGYWSRDGGQLYFSARDRSIMVTEVSTAASFSFQPPTVLFRQAYELPDGLMDISADGSRFLVLPPARGHQLQQLTIFNRRGEVIRKIGEPGLYSQPAFSPDEKKLLVGRSDIKSGQFDYWVMDLQTLAATRITNDRRNKTPPLWSRDGKWLYYTAMHDGDWSIHRRASDGSGSEESLFQYTPGAFLRLSDISPDGKYLIGDSGGVMLLVPIAGDAANRKEIEYQRDEFDKISGRLAPDGRLIAYRSDQAKPEKYEIYVQAFDPSGTSASKTVQVSQNGALGMLHWRKDGREIYYRREDLDSNDLTLMAAEVETKPELHVGTPRVLFQLPGPIGGSLGCMTSDGEKIVLAVNVPAETPARTAQVP